MAKKSKKEAEVKAESNVEQQPTEDPKPETAETGEKVEAKPERPAFNAGFCLDETTWASNERLLDESSESCKMCQKDMPDTHGACKARDAFLSAEALAGKAPKKPGERKSKEPAAPTQGSIINGMLKESKPLKDIIAAVATAYYNGNVKAADGRVKRHIQRGIIGGEARNAAEMKPHVAYLSAKKEEEKKEA